MKSWTKLTALQCELCVRCEFITDLARLCWRKLSYLSISVRFWIMPFLHKLAVTFFLQNKAIDLEHIT